MMKRQLKICVVLTALLFFLNHSPVHAQFLKNVLNSVKQTGQNNTSNKVDQITNNALDKVENLGKKKSKKTTTSSDSSNTASVANATKPAANSTPTPGTNAGGNSANNAPPPNNPYNSDGSFISLNLSSDRIIATGAVLITGTSVKYKNFNSVNYTHLRAHETGRNLVCRLLL